MPKKEHLNLIVIGHVDHGKSTTLGRLMFSTGKIKPQDIEKLKKEAIEKGKETFEFAYVMDTIKEERARGLTIDLAYRRFDTDKYYITIIDAPGHRDFVKNMVTGASQADAAVLVVAADDGVMAQTKEHAWLAKTMGIRELIVTINKMDKVNYSQQRFEEVKSEVSKLLHGIGFSSDQIKAYIPTAALKEDENIVKQSENMNWYKGPTLLDSFDLLSPPEKPIDLPLRLPVQDVYSIKGVGTVPVGRVETGKLKPKQTVIFEPSGIKAEVKTIEMHHEQLEEAIPGDNIGFNVRGVSRREISRGDVVGPVDNPPTVAKSFIAKIVVLEHPTAITAGYTPVFHCHTATVPCKFTKLLKKIDPKSGAVIEENPDFLKKGDAAEVEITPVKPLVIEENKKFPQLSRFAIRDMGVTVGAGVCLKVTPR